MLILLSLGRAHWGSKLIRALLTGRTAGFAGVFLLALGFTSAGGGTRPSVPLPEGAAEINALYLRLQLDPRALLPQLRLGEMFYRLGNDTAARQHLESYLRGAPAGPDSLRAVWLEARSLIRQGMPRRAETLLRRLVRRPGTPAGAWHDWAQLMGENGFPAEAAMAEMRAIEGSDGDTLFVRTARSQWKSLGRPDQALCLTALLLQRQPREAEDLFQAGYLADCLGQRERARGSYENALALNPGHAEGHFNLAQILADQGQVDSAAVHYQAVIRLRPAYEPTYFQLGALLMENGREAEAGDVFRRYLQAGTDSVALAQAAEILRVLGTRRTSTGAGDSSRER